MKSIVNGLLIGILLAGSGCIHSHSGSGIVEIADNTYMHSKMGGAFTWAGSEVKAELFKEANEFCAAKGKKLKILNSTAEDSGWNYASAEIQFQCQ
jgi:hypothetical protein